MSNWNWNRPPSIDPPKWIAEVIKALQENEIQFTIIDPILGIFNCYNKSGGRGYRYYASGGVIVGSNLKGIESLIRLLSTNDNISYREPSRPFVNSRSNQNVLPFYKDIRNGRPVDTYYPRRNTAYMVG